MIHIQATNVLLGTSSQPSSVLRDIQLFLPTPDWDKTVSLSHHEILFVRGCLLAMYIEDYDRYYRSVHSYFERRGAYLVAFSPNAAWFYTSRLWGIDTIGDEGDLIAVHQHRYIEV